LGDVFAQLIEHTFYKQQNIQSAFGYLEKMKKKGIIVSPYLDSAMVEKIYKGMGMQVPNDRKASK
jgi:intraflagellar transport protein 140